MKPFLTARWEHLVLLNYACPKHLLQPLVPRGTELDPHGGVHFVSLVGFMFRDTLVRGIPVPFHRTFEEVNLRFYVRREHKGEVRRGVVFVRELVPRRAIAWIARGLYNEPYRAVPMSHTIDASASHGGMVRYGWSHRGRHFGLEASFTGPAQPLRAGSEAEFITEHYWGYTRQRNGSTLEYRVAHPRWRVWSTESSRFSGEAQGLYGSDFAQILAEPPISTFIALGSAVEVFSGRLLGHS